MARKRKRPAARKTVHDLTDAQVRAIRKKYEKGVTQRELGETYGIPAHTVGRITRGETRVDAGGPTTVRPRAALSRRHVATVRRRYAGGHVTQAQIARELGLSPAAVSRLVRGLTYGDVGGPTVDKGALPHGRKLTPKQILEVARSDDNMSEAARKYGVTRQAIQALRKRWKERARAEDQA